MRGNRCTNIIVYETLLHFQDWGSYMKGAWVLRRAWKIYQRTYTDIRRHYIKRIGLGGNSIGNYIILSYVTTSQGPLEIWTEHSMKLDVAAFPLRENLSDSFLVDGNGSLHFILENFTFFS